MPVIQNRPVRLNNFFENICKKPLREAKIQFLNPTEFNIHAADRFVSSALSKDLGPPNKQLVDNIIRLFRDNQEELQLYFSGRDGEKSCRIFLNNFDRILTQAHCTLTVEQKLLITEILRNEDASQIGETSSIEQDNQIRDYLSTHQCNADEFSIFLAQKRNLTDDSPVTLEEFNHTARIFIEQELEGPAFNSLFWDSKPRSKDVAYDAMDPYIVHITPQIDNAFIISGDLENLNKLKQSLSEYVDENFKLKPEFENHKMIFVGDYNKEGDKELLDKIHIMLRLKIANPHNVLILHDKDNPYFYSKDSEFMKEIIQLYEKEGQEIGDFKFFYRFLPTAAIVNVPGNLKVLLCNDAIKLLINPFSVTPSSNLPFTFSKLEENHKELRFESKEIGNTLKYNYEDGVQSILFRENEFVSSLEYPLRPYINPIEIQQLARNHNLQFDYSRSEKHFYIESPYFGALNKKDTIQYFNSFTSEMSSLAQIKKEEHPEIASIMNKPETEPGDLRALCQAAPLRSIQVAHSYKIHLMPRQELFLDTLDYLFSEIPHLGPEACASLAGIKILTWDKHLKIQMQKNKNKEPTPPSIVIYLVTDNPEKAQKTLDAIYNSFEKNPRLSEGSDITPRFNAKCSSLIYVAQGTGPDKELSPNIKKEIEELKHQESITADLYIKNLLKTQIKSKELSLQTPDLFDPNLVFFVANLTKIPQNYQLHHPSSQEPLRGNPIDNGANSFLQKFAAVSNSNSEIALS